MATMTVAIVSMAEAEAEALLSLLVQPVQAEPVYSAEQARQALQAEWPAQQVQHQAAARVAQKAAAQVQVELVEFSSPTGKIIQITKVDIYPKGCYVDRNWRISMATTVKKCTLVNPESGETFPADILSRDKTRLTVRPTGTKYEIFLVRGDVGIPYRGSFQGRYYTVHLD